MKVGIMRTRPKERMKRYNMIALPKHLRKRLHKESINMDKKFKKYKQGAFYIKAEGEGMSGKSYALNIIQETLINKGYSIERTEDEHELFVAWVKRV